MPELKLAKLPDRMPVKLTITVQPDLAQALREYAAVYRATYGEAEIRGGACPLHAREFSGR